VGTVDCSSGCQDVELDISWNTASDAVIGASWVESPVTPEAPSPHGLQLGPSEVPCATFEDPPLGLEILLVANEPHAILAITEAFSTAGYSVHTVDDPDSAIAAAQSTPFRVLFGLSSVQGFKQVAAAIRAPVVRFDPNSPSNDAIADAHRLLAQVDRSRGD
jgi:CheY-like chemotaxis protein